MTRRQKSLVKFGRAITRVALREQQFVVRRGEFRGSAGQQQRVDHAVNPDQAGQVQFHGRQHGRHAGQRVDQHRVAVEIDEDLLQRFAARRHAAAVIVHVARRKQVPRCCGDDLIVQPLTPRLGRPGRLRPAPIARDERSSSAPAGLPGSRASARRRTDAASGRIAQGSTYCGLLDRRVSPGTMYPWSRCPSIKPRRAAAKAGATTAVSYFPERRGGRPAQSIAARARLRSAGQLPRPTTPRRRREPGAPSWRHDRLRIGRHVAVNPGGAGDRVVEILDGALRHRRPRAVRAGQ